MKYARIAAFIVSFAAAVAAASAAGAVAEAAGAAAGEKPVATLEDLPRDARLALYEAQQKLEKSEIDEAIEELSKYVRDHEKKEDSFLVRYQLAGMLMQANRPHDALGQYERVTALEPRYAPGWIGVGETAYGLGNYKLAADALAQGFERMEEKRPDVLYYASVARVQAGEPTEALPAIEELTSGKYGEPKFEWYRGLVSACLQTGDTERGRRAVSSMLDRFGSDADAWHLAFQYAASIGDYRQAAVALTVTGYLRPLTHHEEMQLGDLYAAIDAPAAAAGYYAEACKDSAGPREIERIASAYLASQQTDEALVVLEQGVKKEPTFRLWSLLGDLHVMEKRYDQAYEAFAESARLSPDEPRPQLMMGYCAIETGRLDDALSHLSKAASDEEYAERAQLLIRRAQHLTRVQSASQVP
jgi:tetratricopeptide (TPR) repeat protein